MKRLLAALAAVGMCVLAPKVGLSKTIIVSGTGLNSVPADSGAALPGVTMNIANSIVKPGDKVAIMDGSYAIGPAPVNAGVAGSYIAYVGEFFHGNVRATPGEAMPRISAATSASFNKSYITYKGLDFQGAIGPRAFDSLAYCRVRKPASGYSSISIGQTSDFMLVGNYIDTFNMYIECTNSGDCSGSMTTGRAWRDTIRNNTIGFSTDPGSGYEGRWRGATEFLVDSNTISSTASITPPSSQHCLVHYAKRNVFRDNNWGFYNNTGAQRTIFYLRDSTRDNKWLRDTIIAYGPSSSYLKPSNAGTVQNSNGNNNWEYCIIKTSGNPAMFWQNSFDSDTLIYNVIASQGEAALMVNGKVSGPALLEHNTFYCQDYTGTNEATGVLSFQSYSNHLVAANAWADTVRVRSNIIALSPNAASPNCADCYGASWFVGSSGDTTTTTGRLQSNNNLYYLPSQIDSTGDRAVRWWKSGAVTGHSSPYYGHNWWITTLNDSASRHDNPRFANTTSVLAFDPTVNPDSAAGSKWTWPDGFVGAIGGDAIAPGTITDLSGVVTNNYTVVLSWTAPGDDGNTGVVTDYDVRFNVVTITSAAFATTSQAAYNQTPVPAGYTESMTITGLAANTTYFFALKGSDERSNLGAMSNVISLTTLNISSGGGPFQFPTGDE